MNGPILGIDPGSRRLGYALLRTGSASVGCIEASADLSFAVRLVAVCSSLSQYLGELDPVPKIFIETVWIPGPQSPRYNLQSAIAIAQLRGAVLKECMLFTSEVHDVAPSSAKKTLTGKGRASQEEVCAVARARTGLDLGEDESDAFAIAYHGWAVDRRALWARKK